MDLLLVLEHLVDVDTEAAGCLHHEVDEFLLAHLDFAFLYQGVKKELLANIRLNGLPSFFYDFLIRLIAKPARDLSLND